MATATDVVKEVMTWMEGCNVSEDWRVLLTKLEPIMSGNGTEDKVHAVCCMLKRIAPVVNDNEVFNEIQKQVISVVTMCVDSITATLSGTVEGKTGPLIEVELLVQILTALAPTPPLLCVSLTTVSLTLSLCNHTEKKHDQVFHQLSSHFGTLFRAAYNLLKACLDLVSSLESHCVQNDLLSALTKVTMVALNFDPSVLVLCWKSLGKLLCNVKGQFCDHTELIIKELCVAIETKAKECLEYAPLKNNYNPNPMFQKLLKVCRFLGTMLLKLTQVCVSDVQTVSEAVLKLLLTVQCNASSFDMSVPALTQVEDNVLLMTEPLLSWLAHSQPFLKSLLSPPICDPWAYGRLVCTCGIVKLLPHMEGGLQEYCLGPTSRLIEALGTSRLMDTLLASFTQCYVEAHGGTRVRGVMCNGQPQRWVTLYEYVATSLCVLLAVSPLEYMPSLEYCLLRHVLSPWQTVSLLCCDVWVFFARLCSQVVVEGYCQLISKLMFAASEGQSLTLGSLLSRLLGLLPSASCHSILLQYRSTPSELRLWASLDPSLTNSHKELLDQVFSLSVKEMSSMSPSLCMALDCLSNQVATTLIESVVVMATQCSSTQLFSHVMKFLSKQTLSLVQLDKVLCSIVDLLTPDCDEVIACSVCVFLSVHFKVREPPKIHIVSKCFRLLMSHYSWLVRQLTLEVFRNFAEFTPNVDDVQTSIASGYTDKVTTFFRKEVCVVDVIHVRALLQDQHALCQSTRGGLSRVIQEWVEFVKSCDSNLSYTTTNLIKQLAQNMLDFCRDIN